MARSRQELTGCTVGPARPARRRPGAAAGPHGANFAAPLVNLLDTNISDLGNLRSAAALEELQPHSRRAGVPGAGNDATRRIDRARAPQNAAQDPPWMRDSKRRVVGRAKQKEPPMIVVVRPQPHVKRCLSFARGAHNIYGDARRRLALRLRYGRASRS
jgi:hypothetical protein